MNCELLKIAIEGAGTKARTVSPSNLVVINRGVWGTVLC